MKLKFKIQPYQTAAVESVVDCFVGQPNIAGVSYRMDPGKNSKLPDMDSAFKNAEIVLSRKELLENIQKVQLRQNLPVSNALKDGAGKDIGESETAFCPNLDIEMETGTGKTYCYIKTMFELNRRYGWSKFIVMVPSIAIREGVYKSFSVMAEHFQNTYGNIPVHFFIYNSSTLTPLENFSSNGGLNVMIINIQAFNATGKDNRRIYDELDEFGSRRPIDVISANRPILILDEPQKMEGKKTLDALKKFHPLMMLRYSATHRVEHNKIHRLDALDAYNQKLVKKIGVHGISVKGLSGTNAYLYLEDIEVSSKAPVARMEMEIKQKGGSIKRVTRKIGVRENLFDTSGGLDEYKGYVVSQIDAGNWTVEFTNGVVLHTGEASGNVNEGMLRRLQIREAVRAHLEKEMRLYPLGIKVLSLFFIDEVAKYRDYDQPDDKGEYARIFEEEYNLQVNELLHYTLPVQNERYREYLESISAERTHNGYFSIDKKNRLVNPSVKKTGEEKGLSDDVDAYELILKDKERLLSFEEPTRFIFSHSALREGWDNPNVFVMCMLKHSDNTISRRQEVGRGLRLCVNQQGERMDNPVTTHQLNVLTVVTSESYTDFVSNLQKEIRETISDRPRKADAEFFKNKVLKGADGSSIKVDDVMANRIHAWLLKNDYIDEATNEISQEYHEAKSQGTLCPMRPELEPYRESVLSLVDSLYLCTRGIPVADESRCRTNNLNANFRKKEFQELWRRINHKAVYRVDFDSDELIRKCIDTLNAELKVTPLKYVVVTGIQNDNMTTEHLDRGTGFTIKKTETEFNKASVHSLVKYDLLGKLAELTNLTRKTLASILSGIHSSTFDLFRQNPENFIAESGRLINEQKATCIIERLSYDCLSERYDSDVFTEAQVRLEGDPGQKLQKHIYDYVATQSGVERRFVRELDTDQDVVVYAKLPSGFFIPTPVGPYNPDWAIAFREGSVKHIYFVAETKGSMSSMSLRGVEETKITCARKFFAMLTEKLRDNSVTYDVVDSYDKLMDIVKA